MTREEIIEYFDIEEPVLFIDPECCDSAIVGITEDHCHLIYDYFELIAAFAEDFAKSDMGGGMEDYCEQAAEWIDVNTIPSLPYQNQSVVPIIMMPLIKEK